MNNKDYYFFNKKYKTKCERREELCLNIKQRLFSFISTNKYLKKKLNPIDRLNEYRDRKEVHITKNYYSSRLQFNKDLENYKDLKLPYISFFEVIEIDKFDDFKKSLISNFSSKHSGFGNDLRYKEELIKKLSDIKINLDSTEYGQLVSLNFKKLKYKHSDLIDFLNISYLKTNESYFILHLQVNTSNKFKEIESKIFESPECTLSIRHFNSFKNIFKNRIFNGHTSYNGSLTSKNIENLISDLQFQISYNILKPLKGYFYTSKLNSKIPSIEHYTIKNLKILKENSNLDSFFNFTNITQFSSKDELVYLFINETKNTIQIIKEEEHGKKINTGIDHTDYDRLESHFLIQSLVFPCVFNSILNEEFTRLNHIKRKMYDFIENSNKWSFYKYFLLFNQNNNYIKLKKEVTKLNLITNRYKNEFNKRALTFLINHNDAINEYQYSNKNRRKNEESDLLNYLLKKFKNEINLLTRKKDDINDVFKNIEELNSYRTNFILQMVSLMIGILAFIFAFDKVKDFFIGIVNK